MVSTSFGYAKDNVKKVAGPELAKMGLSPILNMVLGIEEEGTSNDDIINKIDKSTAEIKAEIGKVMDEVKELSAQTANYHTKQMNQLKAINSNIDTKDFRIQADTVAADFAHALKRIDENKVNITCDGSDKINNTTYKAYKEILADPKCNVSSMQANFDEMLRYLRGQRTSNNNENGYRQLTNYLMDRVVASDLGEHSYTKTPDYYGAVDNIKGLNAKGGFEIPAGRTININMYTYNNGFNGSFKKDMDMFTIQSGASFKIEDAEIRGTNRKFVIPDNAKDTKLRLRYMQFYGYRNNYYNYDCNPCIYVAKKAVNAKIDLEWIGFNYEDACQIQNDSKTTKISEWYVNRYWEHQEHGAEYWGT